MSVTGNGNQFYSQQTTGAGVVSVFFECTANDQGRLTVQGIKGDGGIVDSIVCNDQFPGPPDGVFFIRLKQKCKNILYSKCVMLHETSAIGDMLNGPNIPVGFDASGLPEFVGAYVEWNAGVPSNVWPPAGTRFVFRVDLQTENWGTR